MASFFAKVEGMPNSDSKLPMTKYKDSPDINAPIPSIKNAFFLFKVSVVNIFMGIFVYSFHWLTMIGILNFYFFFGFYGSERHEVKAY